MNAWQPKSSKLGGLPNITFEKCKPIKLGSMLKNLLECISGVFKYQDIVQSPEVQQQQNTMVIHHLFPTVEPFHHICQKCYNKLRDQTFLKVHGLVEMLGLEVLLQS
eukprot:1430608-Ditylum_brightwellii.AAC.1